MVEPRLITYKEVKTCYDEGIMDDSNKLKGSQKKPKSKNSLLLIHYLNERNNTIQHTLGYL